MIKTTERSRISNFYKLSVEDRLRTLFERGLIDHDDFCDLMSSRQILDAEEADRLIENVLGVFGLPMGLGLNFLINGKDFVVPMVVEEPSIVAAVSSAAKLARNLGGFRAKSSESLLMGQIQVVDVGDPESARAEILENRSQIVDLANSLHPRMHARGGGARDVEVSLHKRPSNGDPMVIVNLLVDTRDAMGANLVNTMCEGVAPLVEKITGGKVFLRILSNLTDRSMVSAEVRFPTEALAGRGFTGEQVRDGVILASDFAAADPYRATTHNKGILNGIAAVALATGNDFRAIEAAAHAYAGLHDGYRSLTHWYQGEEGELCGTIEVPLKVGIVGGQMQSNRAVGIAHRLLNVESAKELAEVMAAVGLAQNFAALRALSTDGIQRGHMTLHARSCAVAAGADPEIFDRVVDLLVESGEVKIWKAKEIVAKLTSARNDRFDDNDDEFAEEEAVAAGHGKVILFGEHAAVYGSHAIAAPIPLAIQARVKNCDPKGRLLIPRWGVEGTLRTSDGLLPNSLQRAVDVILRKLGIEHRNMAIEIFPKVPRAMGLGGSAALVVAVTRALVKYFGLDVTDSQVNDIAFECEKIAHGTPSGIDNSLATYGKFTLFRKGDPPLMKELDVPRPIPLVIGLTGVESLTAKMVTRVREAWTNNSSLYDRIFGEIKELTLQAVEAIAHYNLPKLGELMNVCHGLLCSLQVSCKELEELIAISREHGALGAKLTGGGGGGAMIALCPEDDGAVQDRIVAAFRRAGYKALKTEIG